MMAEELLARLEHAKSAGPREWMASCPAHNDDDPSLSVAEGDDGRVLLHCFSGCEPSAIVSSLGLTLSDLFTDTQARVSRQVRRAGARTAAKVSDGGKGISTPARDTATAQQSAGLTLEQYAAAKQLPIESLKRWGLSQITIGGAPVVKIEYRDAAGNETGSRFRHAMDGKGERFRWRNGTKPTLYGLDYLGDAIAAGYVLFVEGESDTHTAWHHGLPAVGVPGASNWNEQRDAVHLDGIPIIYVVIEPDAGGEAMLIWIAKSSIRDRVRLVRLPVKDVSALHLDDPAHFRERLQSALDAAEPWSERERADTEAARADAWKLCAPLALEPHILDRFVEAAHAIGVVGEDRAARLVYLVVVSRLLARIVSAVLKGPSSAGKSYLTECVLSFFDPSAYHALTAMSAHALAYSDEPLAHRILVLYEAAGLEGEFGSYLVRSLLSEGRVRYETVEKTSEGLRPRLIEREGPTGLIVTTTAVNLHPENETRLLTIPVTDTREQTKLVLRALADEERAPIDLSEWHALDAWITLADHEVTIPYAAALAEAIPPVAVRLRRDFSAVLNLIRAHAVLHQATRERDEVGRIIATDDDYSAVRELVADLVSDGVGATVPPTVRQAVAAVSALAPGEAGVMNSAIAAHLQLDKSAASRRVSAAIDRGYLRNLEDRRGRPARIVLGDALPDDEEVLPRVEVLHGCAVAGIATIPPPPTDPVVVIFDCAGCGQPTEQPTAMCLQCEAREIEFHRLGVRITGGAA